MPKRYTIKLSIHEVDESGELDEVTHDWDRLDFASENEEWVYDTFDKGYLVIRRAFVLAQLSGRHNISFIPRLELDEDELEQVAYAPC